MPVADAKDFKSNFLVDFAHLNVAMKTSNDALVPDADKIDELSSKAWEWPLLHVGLRMCSWADDVIKYFLLGNPFIVWSTTAVLFATFLVIPIYILRWQRHFVDFTHGLFIHM